MTDEPTLIMEDEWIFTDPDVKRIIECLTGKPFPDPEKYYRATNIYKDCNFCGRRGAKLLPDPMGGEDEEKIWVCDECWDAYWLES